MFLHVHLNFVSVETQEKWANLVAICENLLQFSAMKFFRVFDRQEYRKSIAEISKTYDCQ
jgi:hypothetical protein